jgi:hypothetical protein
MGNETWERVRAKFSEVLPWLVAALVALSANWAASSIQDSIDTWVRNDAVSGGLVLVRLAYIAIFAAATTSLYLMRQAFLPRTRFLKKESPEKREHLILFLSNLDEKRDQFADGIPQWVSLSGDLDADLTQLVELKETKNKRWSWEMPLRAIRHHLGRLESITVLASKESIQQVHWFRSLLKHYEPLRRLAVQTLVNEEGRVRLIECPTSPVEEGKGWDFEEFDNLSRAVLHLRDELKKRRIADKQIMIDFTGGQKVTSVVAAAVTFNRNIKAQYVQTNPKYDVISYDILMGSLETGGLGI